ncbi:MAG TPA: MotA/TolQ/ExbB proton channel family protein [Gammaproteobacteria bacterium]|nr:MotA/TolQ/ExbB proton channel family protein [Gammaproteobacteria bacterium]
MNNAMQSLSDLFAAGGPVVVVLVIMSVCALAIVLLKLWQFGVLRLTTRGFIDQALSLARQGDAQRAVAVLRAQKNPIAQVMAATLEGRQQLPEALLREEATRLAVGQLENLRSYLRGLEVIGTLAPLLGLLGTVLGMIAAFQQMEAAGSQVDPSILSGGIWEALLTTAVGLIVAIPAIVALNWLERVIERFRHHMEDALTQVFTLNPDPAAPQRPEQVAQHAHAH